MERNLALELVRVTEAAALASARFMGRGDERACDAAAVEAMRRAISAVAFCGTVAIGEGERDEAPMLYIGEHLGSGAGPKVDIAVDPLEGTSICATGAPNALAVIAIANQGNFLTAPDVYMEKLAVGPKAKGVIDLTKSPTENLKAIAEAKEVYVEDLTVVILNRPRHEALIKEVRNSGARIKLIGDGDLSAAIAASQEDSGIDVLMGIGGAPEGVLSAAALRCTGGHILGRLVFRNDDEIERAYKMGISDLQRIYTIEDLAKGDVMFAATGVTDGDFLAGVRFFKGGAFTHSVVMRSKTRTMRYIKAQHHFDFKPVY